MFQNSRSHQIREQLLSLDVPSKKRASIEQFAAKYAKKKKTPEYNKYDCHEYVVDCFSLKSASEIEECLRQRRMQIDKHN